MDFNNRIYNVNDLKYEEYYCLPQILFTHPKYKKLSTDAKVLYSILNDRQELSVENGLIDDLGRVYLIYKIEKLSELLGACNSSVINWKKELVKYGLIIDKRMGLQECNRIYVLKIATETTLEEDLKNIEEEMLNLNKS